MDVRKLGRLFDVYVTRRHSNSIWCLCRDDKLQHRDSILFSIICFLGFWRWPSRMNNSLSTYPSVFYKPLLGWVWKEDDTRSCCGLETLTEFSPAMLSVTWGTLGLLKCCCVCMCALEMGTPSKNTMKPKQCPYCSFLTETHFLAEDGSGRQQLSFVMWIFGDFFLPSSERDCEGMASESATLA